MNSSRLSLIAPLIVLFILPFNASALQIKDPKGDTPGPDLTAMSYNATAKYLDIKLSFSEALCASFINNPNLLATVRLDLDKSLATGFVGGGQLQPRFGVDYEIEIELTGFCSQSDDHATLKYWRYKHEGQGIVSRKKATVPIGNPFYPNGSRFIIGENTQYKTAASDILVRIPVKLFSNSAFPVCSNIPLCSKKLFSCPPVRAFDLRRAYVSVDVIPWLLFQKGIDTLPEKGMIATNSGANIKEYRRNKNNRIAKVADPKDDSYAPPGLNGEEFLRLAAYRHRDGNHTFEIKLRSYNLEDTATYRLLLDLDNNPNTGDRFKRGNQTIGVDLIADYGNFENPIGEANPLEGSLKFWTDEGFCPLNYTDYLANVWRSEPGYIWITLPEHLLTSFPAMKKSKKMRVFAISYDGEFDADYVPNKGFLDVPLN